METSNFKRQKRRPRSCQLRKECSSSVDRPAGPSGRFLEMLPTLLLRGLPGLRTFLRFLKALLQDSNQIDDFARGFLAYPFSLGHLPAGLDLLFDEMQQLVFILILVLLRFPFATHLPDEFGGHTQLL